MRLKPPAASPRPLKKGDKKRDRCVRGIFHPYEPLVQPRNWVKSDNYSRSGIW